MALSENAKSFSIKSLMSTVLDDKTNDRLRATNIYSRYCINYTTETLSCPGADQAVDAVANRITNSPQSVRSGEGCSAKQQSFVPPKEGSDAPDKACERKATSERLRMNAVCRSSLLTDQAGSCGTPIWSSNPREQPHRSDLFTCDYASFLGSNRRVGGGFSSVLIAGRRDEEPAAPVCSENPSVARRDGKAWGLGDPLDTISSPSFPKDSFFKLVHGIRVTLDGSRLWRMFNRCGTEMIVNRNGRRMFPCVVITISGLEPRALYKVQMVLASSDRKRYKFINNQWHPVGQADPDHHNEPFEHPESPSTGAFWMQEKVSFSKLKITNAKESAKFNTVLHSMHKYTPQIIITKLDTAPAAGYATSPSDRNSTPNDGGWPIADRSPPEVACFEFEETSFIAVTAYHSELITHLKIQNNPFAKAFRDADVTAILQNAATFPEPNAYRGHYGSGPSAIDWNTTSVDQLSRATSNSRALFPCRTSNIRAAPYPRHGLDSVPPPRFGQAALLFAAVKPRVGGRRMSPSPPQFFPPTL